MSELAKFIASKLESQRFKQIELTGHLAEICEKSIETTRRWITGEKRMQYEGLEPTAEFLQLKSIDRVELYGLAGYPVPSWLVPRLEVAEHGGMSQQELIVERFNTMDQVYAYVTRQIDEADESVYDLTWGLSWTNTPSEMDAYEAYMQAILLACDRGVKYHEVMIFYRSYPYYFKRALKFLQEFKLSYNLGFYEAPLDLAQLPPLLSFLIVDDHVVVTCLYSDPQRPPDEEILLAIRQPQIIKQFQDYFKEIWRKAGHLKVGDKLDRKELNRLRAIYNTPAEENTKL